MIKHCKHGALLGDGAARGGEQGEGERAGLGKDGEEEVEKETQEQKGKTGNGGGRDNLRDEKIVEKYRRENG